MHEQEPPRRKRIGLSRLQKLEPELLNYTMAFLLTDTAIFGGDLPMVDNQLRIRLAMLAFGNIIAGLGTRRLRRHAMTLESRHSSDSDANHKHSQPLDK